MAGCRIDFRSHRLGDITLLEGHKESFSKHFRHCHPAKPATWVPSLPGISRNFEQEGIRSFDKYFWSFVFIPGWASGAYG